MLYGECWPAGWLCAVSRWRRRDTCALLRGGGSPSAIHQCAAPCTACKPQSAPEPRHDDRPSFRAHLSTDALSGVWTCARMRASSRCVQILPEIARSRQVVLAAPAWTAARRRTLALPTSAQQLSRDLWMHTGANFCRISVRPGPSGAQLGVCRHQRQSRPALAPCPGAASSSLGSSQQHCTQSSRVHSGSPRTSDNMCRAAASPHECGPLSSVESPPTPRQLGATGTTTQAVASANSIALQRTSSACFCGPRPYQAARPPSQVLGAPRRALPGCPPCLHCRSKCLWRTGGMLAAQAASCRHALQPLPCSGPAGSRGDRAWRQQAAGDGRAPPARCRRRRSGAVTARAAADFQQLRSAALDSVAAAQAKLSALEAAQRTAAQAREPAADAERHWQDLHGRLASLTQEAQEATKALRTAVTAAAGGEAEATHALLQVRSWACGQRRRGGARHAWHCPIWPAVLAMVPSARGHLQSTWANLAGCCFAAGAREGASGWLQGHPRPGSSLRVEGGCWIWLAPFKLMLLGSRFDGC